MDRELPKVITQPWRIGAGLSAVMMITYFGFIALVAFGKDAAGTLIAEDRVSIGIMLGAVVIVLAPILTSIYVRWANRRYDVAIAAARKAEGAS